jgi:Tannase and feruloyl esterase
MNRWSLAAAAPLLLVSAAHSQTTASCAALAKQALPHARIARALQVEAGQFMPPGDAPNPATAAVYQHAPAFCRVEIRSTPTPDSDIGIEVWLPIAKWNGKFRGQGNGGFAGAIYYEDMARAISQGYATAGTDTGHVAEGTDASWSLNHPEKINDFGYRGMHEMTVNAKAVIASYYGKAAARSYLAACSDGGREALMEAQRFPNDYDGILAGAPAYNWTNLLTGGMTKMHALLMEPGSHIPPAKLPAIASAVLAACDADDGVKDGILNDPRTCHFKPETLACKGADSDSCLTPPQVDALKLIYAPITDSKGKLIFPGTMPGGELGGGGWGLWVFGEEPNKSLGAAFGYNYFTYMVYRDAHWDPKTFNVDDGLKLAIERTATAVNSTDPNLKAFAAHGGKLILYHGWNDAGISPLSTIDYYGKVVATNSNAQTFTRLFMAPGMQHCSGGPGPSSFGQGGWRPGAGPDDAQHNLYRALEDWVDQGVAPEQVIAAKIEADEKTGAKIVMTRPLCAYPKHAKYIGNGDTNDAANFTCSE